MCGRTCVPSHSLIASFCLQQSPSVPHQEGQAPAIFGLQPIQSAHGGKSQRHGLPILSGCVFINFGAETYTVFPYIVQRNLFFLEIVGNSNSCRKFQLFM